MRVPAMEVCTMGMTSPSSLSKTEEKFALAPRATRQYLSRELNGRAHTAWVQSTGEHARVCEF